MTKMLREIMEQPKVLAGIEEENREVLKKLVAELNERGTNHVVFAGRGTSDHASIYCQYLLGIYKGAVASLAIPSAITLYDGKLDYKDDLVVGVSQSGKAADALAVIERGNKNNAITLAVTNDKDSPMAKAAKYHLYCNAGPELSVAATKTFTSQMYVMALFTAYWSGNEKLLSDLRKLPQIAEKLLEELPNKLTRFVDRYRYIKEGFVLARGICYPIALEFALKTQETCYIKMKGYAQSDFYHGPLAQVDSETPVIVIAAKGVALDDSKAIISKINEIGTQIFVITDDKELSEENPFSLLLPDTGNDATSAILFAITAQSFAQMLSVSKGLNPDQPRLLKKVTITK